MTRSALLALLVVVAEACGDSTDDDDACGDADRDGVCDEIDCLPDDPEFVSVCEDPDCPDADEDGWCDQDDCDPTDDANYCLEDCGLRDCHEDVGTDDSDGDGFDDDEDCYWYDADRWLCDCTGIDSDGDGHCDDEDCYPGDPDDWVCDTDDCDEDADVWDCPCADTDQNRVCDYNEVP